MPELQEQFPASASVVSIPKNEIPGVRVKKALVSRPHSPRNATTGSTRAARRAGIAHATPEMIARQIATAA